MNFATTSNKRTARVSYSIKTPWPRFARWLTARTPEGAERASAVPVLRVSDFAVVGTSPEQFLRRREEVRMRAEDADEMVPCPHCEESIRAAAKVCRHCHRDIDPCPTARHYWEGMTRYREGERRAGEWTRDRWSQIAAVVITLAMVGTLAAIYLTSRQVRPVAFTVPVEPSEAVVRAMWEADTRRRIREERGAFYANHPELWDAAAREGWVVPTRR